MPHGRCAPPTDGCNQILETRFLTIRIDLEPFQMSHAATKQMNIAKPRKMLPRDSPVPLNPESS